MEFSNRKKYNSPRVLTCLHVFCESCLDKLLFDESGDIAMMNRVLDCPICKQPTKVGASGASSLPQHYIMTNILDLSTIEPSLLACTSCKNKETAISRCSDCATFLCGSCDIAHKCMRCFENHHVVQLDELRQSAEKVTIHKPLYCQVHPSENLKYYCFSCQVSFPLNFFLFAFFSKKKVMAILIEKKIDKFFFIHIVLLIDFFQLHTEC
jgi:tripartite motif-containing protein 2/3